MTVSKLPARNCRADFAREAEFEWRGLIVE
jgi:hypothetical protein